MNTIQKYVLPSLIGEELARSLTDSIIFLELQPGSRIIEENLGEIYGLSRSPVREALRIVEAQGLVVRSARRGVRVAPLSQANLAEVYACREALEALAAFEAAKHADRAILNEMRESIEGMRSAKDVDVKAFFAQNVRFTRAIHRASRNATLQTVLDGIEKQSLRYRYLAHLHSREMLELSFDGQVSMYDAINERRPAFARRRAVRLIREAHRVISSVVHHVFESSSAKASA